MVIKSLVGTWFRKSLIGLFIPSGKRTIEYLLSFGTIFVTTIFSFYFEIKVKVHFHHTVLARAQIAQVKFYFQFKMNRYFERYDSTQ